MFPTESEFSWHLERLLISTDTVTIFSKIERPIALIIVSMVYHVSNWYLIVCSSKRVKMETLYYAPIRKI